RRPRKLVAHRNVSTKADPELKQRTGPIGDFRRGSGCVPGNRTPLVEADQCRREPISGRVMKIWRGREIPERDLLVEPDQMPAPDEHSVERARNLRQLGQGRDAIRPSGRSFFEIREAMQLDLPKPPRKFSLRDEREQ